MYGLRIVPAPVAERGSTVEVPALRALARRVRPRLITIGGSLNLFPHPVEDIRKVADEVGARVLFDAAHLCGMIAGRAWPSPLAEGADMITMRPTRASAGRPAGSS